MYYSMPYEKSPCSYELSVDGKEQIAKPTVEVQKCEREMERTQIQQQKLQQKNEYNRQLSESVALTVVGFPIWLLHFWLIQLDWKRSHKKS